MMAALAGPGWHEIETLIRLYGVKRPKARGKAFEVLVQTILSQNTNDLNSGRAFNSLKKKVGISPESLSRADAKVIADAIRGGGLHNIKAPRIREVAVGMMERYPDGLGFLSSLDDEGVRQALSGFKGVGPKTMDIVLDFALGRDVVPVDTHVNRVSKRIGYVDPHASYDEVRSALEAVIPRGRRLQGHISLIIHGRKVCKAQRPLCGSCQVSSTCRYFADTYSKGGDRR
jgi:endonuclease-3